MPEVLKEPKTQIEFVAKMFYEAFPHRAFRDNGSRYLWLRGLHYYIVSLPEEQRMMPAARGTTRLYQNTFKEIWKGKKRKQIMGMVRTKLDTSQCMRNCRLDEINRYLDRNRCGRVNYCLARQQEN